MELVYMEVDGLATVAGMEESILELESLLNDMADEKLILC
jgi:hypothetical protein